MTNADAGIAGAMGKTPGRKTPLAARVAAARATTSLNQTALSLAAGLVRVRGDDWSWPDADAVRGATKAPERHGLTLVRLTDDRRRVVLLAA